MKREDQYKNLKPEHQRAKKFLNKYGIKDRFLKMNTGAVVSLSEFMCWHPETPSSPIDAAPSPESDRLGRVELLKWLREHFDLILNKDEWSNKAYDKINAAIEDAELIKKLNNG
jgi:hypothetical protein